MGKIYVGNCSFDVTEQQLRDCLRDLRRGE